ncbi:Mpo1 family 2-hydroxy fatty acid dioxygenase [Piscinibacter sakaiensis]|uniref:Membrane protein n=1 Tax=Piscinibacter sakaiensis TaxID=1547922 RepID=A0A0K8P0V3_PISS1|nr:Mpo1-like protein [Piscinibacter sakaiensis]GAP36261.1 membrane protein [Piscinibacter sakaiensis]
MRTLVDQLANYAAYHRDPRNVVTHFIGIPMIVVAVAMLLSRPVFGTLAGVALSPALAVVLASGAYYLALDRRFGLVMAALLAASLAAGQWAAAEPTAVWLAWGGGLFVVGWAIQFLGHVFEGRKPAFVDDLMGLLIGPLFLVAELAFMAGWRAPVQREIEARLQAAPRPPAGGVAAA